MSTVVGVPQEREGSWWVGRGWQSGSAAPQPSGDQHSIYLALTYTPLPPAAAYQTQDLR